MSDQKIIPTFIIFYVISGLFFCAAIPPSEAFYRLSDLSKTFMIIGISFALLAILGVLIFMVVEIFKLP